jgi:putative ABC transport system permease protein
MNIVNRLTIRNMWLNKRRTLVTIVGVIISVAMVTAVTTLGVSFMDLLQRATIARDGEWHILYRGVNQQQIQAIKNAKETKTLVLSRDLGYALLAGNQNSYKPYLFIKEYDAQGFQQFPIELIKGRLPQAANEMVVSEEIAQTARVNFQIGDQLLLDVGNRVKADDGLTLTQNAPLQTRNGEVAESLNNKTRRSYTVVGIIARPTWEPAWAPGYTAISYVDEKSLGENDTVNALVVLNKVRKSLYTHAQNLAQQNNIATVEFNNELLRYYGVTDMDNLQKTLNSLIAIIMTIIVIGSVALIYNAFAISVAERSRHLGMLSSVGATRKQKRDSVFFEGAVIALISIPLGVLCGLGGLAVTFWIINPMIEGIFGGPGISETFRVTVTPMSILGAAVISLLTIFISTYWPAQRASNVSAIDAIRQTTDIKLNKKAVKTSELVRRLFGFEAEIGLKNLKRNKRRYHATVFSLVISIILFLTVSYFTDSMRKSTELSQDGINFDIQVTIPEDKVPDAQQLIKTIAGLKHVTEYSVVKGFTANSWINQELIPQELKEKIESSIKDEKYSYYIDIYALDEKSLRNYAPGGRRRLPSTYGYR